ncbi:hypothetical protein C3495_06365 [Clostridiaceae bacterium 14S0207]|nr:hypothetical protein C3495_06365 [Clostridiaceae bacterium 14S0207]
MEKSGFFNAMKVGDTWDRIYKAENFAEYFATFIGNGIFPNPASQLQVVQADKMQIIIRQGKAWINGFIYINTDDLILNVDTADGVLNRKDKVVLQYDVVKRDIRAVIKKGEFASNPITPELARNADMYELALADIQVNAGAIKITQADITDLRFNKELCGLVHTTVEQIDSTVIFKQFESWYEQKQNEYDKDIQIWTKRKKREFEEQFLNWFDTLKKALDGDISGKLLNLINENSKEIKSLNEELKASRSIKDDSNNKNYKIGIENGLLYYMEVE